MKHVFTLVLFTFTLCAPAFAQNADEQTLLKLDQEFITAMLKNDGAALERLTDSGYQGFNQFGQSNDRAAFLTLYKTMQTSALSTSNVKVKLAGETALVSGKQRETSTSNFGREQFLTFLHVWVRRTDGWKVLVKQQQFDPAEGTVTPTGWNGQSNANFLVGTDNEVKHGGTASAFIKSKYAEGSTALASGLTQVIKADAYRGKRLRLSGYVKGAVAFGLAFPWMRVNAEHEFGEPLSFDNRLSDGFFVRPDWSSFAIVLDVPTQAAAISFGFQLNGRGHVWLDDWTLEVVDAGVPSTHLAASEAVRKRLDTLSQTPQGQQQLEASRQRLPTLAAAPVNLDFESTKP